MARQRPWSASNRPHERGIAAGHPPKARAHGRWTAVLGYEGIAATTPDSPSSEPEPSDQDAGFGRIGVYERREASALVCEQGYRIPPGLHDRSAERGVWKGCVSTWR